jgi:hypothetical protein
MYGPAILCDNRYLKNMQDLLMHLLLGNVKQQNYLDSKGFGD